MGDKSYAAKIDRWQSTVNNLAAAIPAIPEADEVYAEVKEMVAELAQAHATLVQMEGRRKEIVRVRRQLSLETERAMRRLVSITRGHLGFGNPVLDLRHSGGGLEPPAQGEAGAEGRGAGLSAASPIPSARRPHCARSTRRRAKYRVAPAV